MLLTAIKSGHPTDETVNLKSEVLVIVALVGLAVLDAKSTPTVNDSQSIDEDALKESAVNDKPPPTPQKASPGTEESITGMAAVKLTVVGLLDGQAELTSYAITVIEEVLHKLMLAVSAVSKLKPVASYQL